MRTNYNIFNAPVTEGGFFFFFFFYPLSMGFSQARLLEWVAISFCRAILSTSGQNTSRKSTIR